MITIRRTEDLQAIVDLDKELITPAMKETELAGATWWLAELEGAPVGYAGIKLIPGEGKAFLCRAGVVEAARGKGLQKRLIRVRTRFAKSQGVLRCYTYVKDSNLASMRSLLSCGFRPYYFERGLENGFVYLENRPKPTV